MQQANTSYIRMIINDVNHHVNERYYPMNQLFLLGLGLYDF